MSQTVTSTYGWPDFQSLLARGGHAGRLYVPRAAGGWRWRSGPDDLQAALDRAFQATDNMPRCYHGVVRRDLLERVRRNTGAYFHGSSPDMSGALAMACLVDRYCEVDLPLTISGVSGGSNSGRSALNKHKGDLASETQTSGFQNAGWTAGVPRFFAVETVWAHAGLSTLQYLRPDLVAQFNYARLLALCTVRHPDFAALTAIATTEAQAIVGGDVAATVASGVRRVKLERLNYLARRAMWPTAANGRRFFAKVETVAAASQQYEQYAATKSISFAAVAVGFETPAYPEELLTHRDGRTACQRIQDCKVELDR